MRTSFSSVSGCQFSVIVKMARKDLPFRAVVEFDKMTFGM